MALNWNRWKHFTAMALIGDGVLAMIRPQHSAGVWTLGPRPWREAMRALEDRPGLTRLLGGLQAATVLCWMIAQEKAEEPKVLKEG
jgi:hypothetical protein